MPLVSTDPLPPADVVAVGAHPDDVDVACGGTLARLADQGHRVAIIDLTDGEPTPNCPDVATRLRESDAAAGCLGVAARIQLNLPNRRLFDGFEPRLALARVLRKIRPRIVIGFAGHTPMASVDHHQAALITDAAIFYARLTKWDDHFDDPPCRILRHLYFRMPLEPELLPGNAHHVVVDITTTLQKKLDAIACFATQFDHKPNFIGRVRSAAETSGSLSGCAAAETFAMAKSMATDDLMRTLNL